MTVLLPIEEVVRIHWQLGVNVAELGNLLFQYDHLFRVRIGQRPEQHVIDKREDSRSCADSQGEREDGSESKARGLAQLAQSMTNIRKRRAYQVRVAASLHSRPDPTGMLNRRARICPGNELHSTTKIRLGRFRAGWRLIPGRTGS